MLIYKWLLFYLPYFHLINLHPSHAQNNLLSGNYIIRPESKLFLTGKSNITDFRCKCLSKAPEKNVNVRFSDKLAVFQNAFLHIPSGTLNCQNSVHNYNIRKFLESEHFPFINIQLIYLQLVNDPDFDQITGSCELYSNVIISIKDIPKLQEIFCQGIKLGPRLYHLKGSHRIKMSAYQIDPPELFMGIIRIEDEIQLHFDLLIEWKPL